MIQSMTGFGTARFEQEVWAFELEIRSVNHRHLDVRIRLPRQLSSFEADLRSRVRGRFSRGKFDLSVTLADGAPPARLELDLAVAREYLAAGRVLSGEDGVPGTLDVASLLALPGVACFAEPELSAGSLAASLLRALDTCLDALGEMRASEGAALARDLSARLEAVSALIEEIGGRAGDVREAACERLRRRARQLEAETGLLDEARLHQEIALAAERMDVSEELVRLRSHVEQFRGLLSEAGVGQPVGRSLDFLLQEFVREANTIGSKANDAPVAHWVVELKTELERLREQVQNVE